MSLTIEYITGDDHWLEGFQYLLPGVPTDGDVVEVEDKQFVVTSRVWVLTENGDFDHLRVVLRSVEEGKT